MSATATHHGDTETRRKLLREELTEQIIGAAIEVYRELGPGLLESAYQECLCHELNPRNIPFARQVAVPVRYKGISLDCGHRLDLLVDDCLILESQCVEQLLPIHSAQLLTYLKLTGKKVGLILNFQVPVLRDGIVRKVR